MPSYVPLTPDGRDKKRRFRRFLRHPSPSQVKVHTSSFSGISASSSSESQKVKKTLTKNTSIKSRRVISKIPPTETRGLQQIQVNRSSSPFIRCDIDEDSNATPEIGAFSKLSISRSASKKIYRRSTRSSNNLTGGSSNDTKTKSEDKLSSGTSSGDGSVFKKAQTIAKFSIALNSAPNPAIKKPTDMTQEMKSIPVEGGGPKPYKEACVSLPQKALVEEEAKLHTSEEKKNAGYNPLSLACNAALTLVGGVGSAVETCVAEMSTGSKHHDSSLIGVNALLRSEGSFLTLDTYERYELEDEIDRLERLNSWETNGSLGTTHTIETAGETVNGLTEASNSVASPMGGTSKIPRSGRKKGMNIGKTRRKRKKVVNFEYPPISSMKEVPRVTTEEMKVLFFTEDELDEYERDRRHNISDDVEVVAVQYSSSEESEEDSNSEEFTFQKAPRKVTSTSMGSVNVNDQSKSILRESKWKQTLNVTNPIESDGLNQIYSKSTSASSSRSFKGSSSGKVISSPRYKSSRSHDSISSQTSAGRKRESGKLKGVQIYLRPRSTGKK